MSAISDALARAAGWGDPHTVKDNPFRLACVIEPPAELSEVETAWSGGSVPSDLAELWSLAGGGRLFEDIDHGQWGLRILSPVESAERTSVERSTRPHDYLDGDVVLGEFLGDQDLLVVTASGGVLIALPLDPRGDWWRPAPDLGDFLKRYVQADGLKYWESCG